jgi:hypothetical protein
VTAVAVGGGSGGGGGEWWVRSGGCVDGDQQWECMRLVADGKL